MDVDVVFVETSEILKKLQAAASARAAIARQ
jgi:hypothetical protein